MRIPCIPIRAVLRRTLLLLPVGLSLCPAVAHATPATPSAGGLALHFSVRGGPAVPVGKPFGVDLLLTRSTQQSQVLYLRLETVDADIVPAAPFKAAAQGQVAFDISALPVGKASAIPFDVTIRAGEGAGISAIGADNLGAHGEAPLHFAMLDADYFSAKSSSAGSTGAYAVATAGEVLAPQAVAFQKGTPWAQAQVSSNAALAAPVSDQVAYSPVQRQFMPLFRWPSEAARRYAEEQHAAWDGGAILAAPSLTLSGRVVFPDTMPCTSATGAHAMSQAACHRFMHRVDQFGVPFTAERFEPDAFRPLPATLAIEYVGYRDGRAEQICDLTAVQTRADGSFRARLLRCGTPGLQYSIRVTAFLEYQLIGAPGDEGASSGYIRAFWQNVQMRTLFPETDSSIANYGEFTRPGAPGTPDIQYSTPAVQMRWTTTGTEPTTIDLGTRVVAAAAGDNYNYLRNLLSGFATLVQVHLNTRPALGNDAQYLRLFQDTHMSGRPRVFPVYFDGDRAGGDQRGVVLLMPMSGPGFNPGMLSDTGILSHEFGHAVHHILAGSSFYAHYDFADLMTRPNGTTYTWSHGRAQYQEMGVAFTEGMASAIGQYLLNGCADAIDTERAIGALVPFSNNMWSGQGNDADDGAPLHHFRYQVREVRRILEGSSDWISRLDAVRRLSTRAVMAGHTITTSNSEGRLAMFGCDLLDSDTSLRYVSAFAPRAYVEDFTSQAWAAMQGLSDGTPRSIVPYTPPSSSTESVQLSLGQLLAAMSAFCPDCPGSLASRDQTSAAYNTNRISVNSALQSPLRLARFLINARLTTRDQIVDVLRANFMEDSGL